MIRQTQSIHRTAYEPIAKLLPYDKRADIGQQSTDVHESREANSVRIKVMNKYQVHNQSGRAQSTTTFANHDESQQNKCSALIGNIKLKNFRSFLNGLRRILERFSINLMKNTTVAPKEELKVLNKAENQTSKSLRSRKVVDISFRDIKYNVLPQKKGGPIKTVLDKVTGLCPGGQLTAILGSSGAGKTSLLNILACRVKSSSKVTLRGQLLANGLEYSYDQFSQFASYVMQNDILMETMTPRESLTFVANLKYSDPVIQASRVQETLKCMKLEKCANTFIGGVTMKGISGGERKRTSIGFELVSNPSCILLDEPTSGLDSFTAFQIMQLSFQNKRYTLKELAEQQDRTVVFTIHQPSTDIFLLFDRIMLLVKGRFIYQGPQADLSQIISYFSRIGFKCPDHSNPMDYLLSIMHTDNPDNLEYFPVFFEQYEQNYVDRVKLEIQDQCTAQVPFKLVETSLIHQIALITHRAFLNFGRDPMQLKARIFTGIFQGLIHGGVFWAVGDNDGSRSDLFSAAGSLFFLTINYTMGSVMQVILGFTVEREVFLREENSKLYTTSSYFIGKQFIEVPFCVIQPVIQGLISYWMCSYNDEKAEFVPIHIFICILLFLCANSMGLMAGCGFSDVKAATSITPMVLMPLILFSGFFANQKNFFIWIGWLQYISPVKYAYEAVSLTEYDGRNYEVDPAKLYDFKLGVWPCIFILIGFIFVYRMLALMFLYGLKSKLQ